MDVVDFIRSWRAEAQVVVGGIALALPTLIRPLQFPLSCMAPVWFLISKLILIKDASVGSHWRLAAMTGSALTLGGAWAACLMSFVKAVTSHWSIGQLVLTCVLASLGSIFIAVGRACPSDPVWIWSLSVASLYGVVVISSVSLPTAAAVWLRTGWLVLTVVLSATALVLVSVVVLPTSAATLLVELTSQILHDTGTALDMCLRVVCIPPELDDKSISFHGVVRGASEHHLTRAHRLPASVSKPHMPRQYASVPDHLHDFVAPPPAYSAASESTAAAYERTRAAGVQSSTSATVPGTASSRFLSVFQLNPWTGSGSPANSLTAPQMPTIPQRGPGPVCEGLQGKGSALGNAGRAPRQPLTTASVQLSEEDFELDLPLPPLVTELALSIEGGLPHRPSGAGSASGAGGGYHRRRSSAAGSVGAGSEPPVNEVGEVQLHVDDPGGVSQPLSLLQHALSVPAAPGLIQRTASGPQALEEPPRAGARGATSAAPKVVEVLHDELTEEEYFEVMYHTTEPPKVPQIKPFTRLPPRPGAHILPSGSALKLRQALELAQKYLASAALEAPWFHAWEGWWAQLWARVRAWCGWPTKPSPRACTRFSVPAWKAILADVAGLLDSLSAFEAVARDMDDGGLPEVHAYDHSHHDTCSELGRDMKKSSSVWSLWLMAKGTTPVEPENQWAHHPHSLHTVVRTALVDASTQASQLGSALGRWPLVVGLPGVNQEGDAGAEEYVRGWDTEGKQHPTVRHAPADSDAEERPRSILKRRLGAAMGHSASTPRMNGKGGTSSMPAGSNGVATSAHALHLPSGTARGHPTNGVSRSGMPSVQPLMVQHSMAWHKKVLGEAMLLRNRDYWLHTVQSARAFAAPGADGKQQPLMLLRTEMLRAQYYVAMAALQLANQLEELTCKLHHACSNTQRPPSPRAAPTTPGKPAPPAPAPPHAPKPQEAARSGVVPPASGAGEVASGGGCGSPPPPPRGAPGKPRTPFSMVPTGTPGSPQRLSSSGLVRSSEEGARRSTGGADVSGGDSSPATAQCAVVSGAGDAALQVPGANVTPPGVPASRQGSGAGGQGSRPRRRAARVPLWQRYCWLPSAYTSLRAWWRRDCAWLDGLVDVWLARGYWRHLSGVALDVSAALRGGWPAVRVACRNRYWIAGVKYWSVVVVLMLGVVLILRLAPAGTMISPPFFAFITGVTVMRHQVETSFTHLVARVVGTTLGSTLAYVLMINEQSANNPYLVSTVLGTTVALLSPLSRTTWRLVSFVTATSVWSTALCQYVGCCGAHGTLRYALERMISVSIGCLIPVVVNHTVYPWYLSQWALSKAGVSYTVGTQMLAQEYAQMVTQLGGTAYTPSRQASGPGLSRAPSVRPGTSIARAATAPPMKEYVLGPLPRAGRASSLAGGRDHSTGMSPPPHTPGGAVAGTAGEAVGGEAAPGGAGRVPATRSRTLGGAQPSAGGAAARVSPALRLLPDAVRVRLERGGGGGGVGAEQPRISDGAGIPGPLRCLATHITNVLMGAGGPAVKPKEPKVTQAQVLNPLTDVVATLARDATLWHRGLLATPQAVHALMAACTLFADRLAAFQVALQGAQSLSWAFSSWIRRHLMIPLHTQNSRVLVSIGKLAQLTTALLATQPHTPDRTRIAQELQGEVQHILALRAVTHRQHLMLRQALHVKVVKMVMARERAAVNAADAGASPALAAATPTRPSPVPGTHGSGRSSAMAAALQGHASGGGAGGGYTELRRSLSRMSGSLLLPVPSPGKGMAGWAAITTGGAAIPPGSSPGSGLGSGRLFTRPSQRGSSDGRPAGLPPVTSGAALDAPFVSLPSSSGGSGAGGGGAGRCVTPAAGVRTRVSPFAQVLSFATPLPDTPPRAAPARSSRGATGASGGVTLVAGGDGSASVAGAGLGSAAALFAQHSGSQGGTRLVRGLSEFVDVRHFHPSDSVVWLACLYAMVHALDAAIHVARVALAAVACTDIGHPGVPNHTDGHVAINLPSSTPTFDVGDEPLCAQGQSAGQQQAATDRC